MDRSLDNLHPIMRPLVNQLVAKLHWLEWKSADGRPARFALFEAYRSPERQDRLFEQGNVTKARGWQSAHQYGLAVDFAVIVSTGDWPENSEGWAWPDDAPWPDLKAAAERCGLRVPIEWDRGHVEHPAFRRVRDAF